MKRLSLFFLLFISFFALFSCGSDEKGDEITPPDNQTIIDLSKAEIKESDSQTYNSTFEVVITDNNNKYKVNLKTCIYNYDKLVVGQSIKDSIEVASVSINNGEEFEAEIISGDTKVTSITNDKLTLEYDKLSFKKKTVTRDINIFIIVINGKIIYSKDKLSKEFTIDGKKATLGVDEGAMIIVLPTSKYTSEFQAIINNGKFYTCLKKNTNQYLIKGSVINHIIDYIYTGPEVFFIKKGKVVLYDITEKTAQLYFDNVLLVCDNKEMVANGILKFKEH